MRQPVVFYLIAAALLGCGSMPSNPSDAGITTDAGPALTVGTCNLTGGKTGMFGCTFTSATYSTANNSTQIVIGSAASADPGVTMTVKIASTPAAATYSGGVADTECEIALVAGGDRFISSTTQAIGTCSTTVRAATQLTNTNGMRTYTVTGSFSASLEPESGAGETVRVQGAY